MSIVEIDRALHAHQKPEDRLRVLTAVLARLLGEVEYRSSLPNCPDGWAPTITMHMARKALKSVGYEISPEG